MGAAAAVAAAGRIQEGQVQPVRAEPGRLVALSETRVLLPEMAPEGAAERAVAVAEPQAAQVAPTELVGKMIPTRPIPAA